MMNKSWMIAIVALLLASCSTAPRQNSEADTKADSVGVDSIARVDSIASTAPDEDDDADELAGVPDTFFEFLRQLPSSPDKKLKCHQVSLSGSNPEAFSETKEVYTAYPLKSGGYMTVLLRYESEEASLYFWGGTYTYINKEVHRVYHVLPVPKIDDIINPENCKKYSEKDVADMRKGYANSTDCLVYSIDGETGILSCDLYNDQCDWCEMYGDMVTFPHYTWNGEAFVTVNE